MTSSGDKTTLDETLYVKMIRMADGTLIDPKTRRPISAAIDPPARQRAEIEQSEDDADESDERLDVVATARRSIADIRLDPRQQALVNNVLVYTLYGLPPDEIATLCQCTLRDVSIIRDLDEYREMKEILIDAVADAYSATVQGILVTNAAAAAKKVVKFVKHKNADVSLSAARDVLDRSGHRPVDRVEHSHSINAGSELVIRVIKETDRTIPTIDLSRNA
jgi:hypothetical protein